MAGWVHDAGYRCENQQSDSGIEIRINGAPLIEKILQRQGLGACTAPAQEFWHG
ncbi:MAG: hypothetical protein QOH05_203, partial [Acetobacteraceae bacterium]|nr:hypothetical protein [Acetobacteraceae bacterium]